MSLVPYSSLAGWGTKVRRLKPTYEELQVRVALLEGSLKDVLYMLGHPGLAGTEATTPWADKIIRHAYKSLEETA